VAPDGTKNSVTHIDSFTSVADFDGYLKRSIGLAHAGSVIAYGHSRCLVAGVGMGDCVYPTAQFAPHCRHIQ
jgi:hypothetical protein